MNGKKSQSVFKTFSDVLKNLTLCCEFIWSPRKNRRDCCVKAVAVNARPLIPLFVFSSQRRDTD